MPLKELEAFSWEVALDVPGRDHVDSNQIVIKTTVAYLSRRQANPQPGIISEPVRKAVGANGV